MRSLRARFFLISWPLVVVAVGVVAFGLHRWTRQEFERHEVRSFRGPAGEQLEVHEKIVLDPAGAAPGPGLRERAERVVWISALAASLAAAAAAWLLAGPLAAQVGRLENAARRLAAGELTARVPLSRRSRSAQGDELARLERSFNAMAEALERAEIQKRNLVSDVAHELRTPLTNLRGTIEAMEDGLRAPDAAALSSLREEVGLLTALVEELQELALAESGQLALELEEVDAVAAARAALDALKPASRGQQLRGPTASEPLLVRADRRRLAQVLRNLIENALRHTPPHGEIRVEVERRGERVALAVADAGRGIPREHLPLIFERFHRVDPSRQRGSGGMGLGLAVARQLVQAMDGAIEVESREGVGSTFTVVLPSAGAPTSVPLLTE